MQIGNNQYLTLAELWAYAKSMELDPEVVVLEHTCWCSMEDIPGSCSSSGTLFLENDETGETVSLNIIRLD